MRAALALALTLAAPAAAQSPWEGYTYPSGKPVECYCTDGAGDRVDLGERACLRVGGRAFTALCDMSQNVPTWRDTGEGCLSSSLQHPAGPGQPVLQSRPVHAPVRVPEA